MPHQSWAGEVSGVKKSDGEKDHPVKPDDDVAQRFLHHLRLSPMMTTPNILCVTLGLDPRVLFHFAYFNNSANIAGLTLAPHITTPTRSCSAGR